MASIIEAFKQTEFSPANNNSDKLAAILLWNAESLKKVVVKLAIRSKPVRKERNLDLIDDSLHEKMSSAFGLYRQWLWLQAIFGDALYKQDLSDSNLISELTKEIIDREVRSEYYFDDGQYMATVYDSFVADVREARQLYIKARELATAADSLVMDRVKKNFYQLLLNPWLYVKYWLVH